ncbi:MAG: hypothetical protein KJZ98_17180 [Burkholderiaceae bacterium]|nr:hypothetical protein [Burkholderiaceae bacterium]
MAVRKYLKNNAGTLTEEAAVNSSAGASDEGKIPALNASGVLAASIVNSVGTSAGAGDSGKLPSLDGSGKLDNSFMPVGIGADTASISTSETLAAGDFVNIWDSTGAKVRKADATTAGKEAHGFVLSAFTHPTTATVYFEGTNTAVSGKTPGVQFLQTTAGTSGSTAPSSSGNVVQKLGVATSATTINFEPQQPIVLA